MELRDSAAHVFVGSDELDSEDSIALDPTDAHHLARVLRLRSGEMVSASDGQGRWRPARWVGGDRVEPCGAVHVVDAAEPPITVGFTPVKGDRPEWTVQKLTELGVDRIIPLRAARSVVRWEGDRAAGQVDRLRRVAREAAMQARRCILPAVDDVTALGAAPGALAEFGGLPISLEHPAVLIGPEGGWDRVETEGRAHVSLGPLVLRAETAAVAAAVLLGALRFHAVVTREHGQWS